MFIVARARPCQYLIVVNIAARAVSVFAGML